jgi:hypothetical protein
VIEPQEPRSTRAEHPAPEELSEFAFSPEDATAALRGHVEACRACGTEVADLRTVLASLAEFPEPVVPVSVGIRLDAAIARAWQEADAEHEAATRAGTGVAVPSRAGSARPRTRWHRLALPLGTLCLVVLGVIGVGELLGEGNVNATSAGGSTAGAAPAAAGDSALTAWVRSVLPGADGRAGLDSSPQAAAGSSNGFFAHPECADVPARAGYTLVATSQRVFHGRQATLVVYQNDQEPASAPLFAVAYAGSCPTPSSMILDEGVVSR